MADDGNPWAQKRIRTSRGDIVIVADMAPTNEPPIDLGRAKDLLADALGQVMAMKVRNELGSNHLYDTLAELFTVIDK